MENKKKNYNEYALKKWIIVEAIIFIILLSLSILAGGFAYRYFYHKTLIHRELSPNKEYELAFYEIGSPRIYSGDVVKVSLTNNPTMGNSQPVKTDFTFEVPNDGAHARFDVDWTEEGVFITFKGRFDSCYFLPYCSGQF